MSSTNLAAELGYLLAEEEALHADAALVTVVQVGHFPQACKEKRDTIDERKVKTTN
jgi:hypothetical protein